MLTVCYVMKEMGGGPDSRQRISGGPVSFSGQAVPVIVTSSRYGNSTTVSRLPTCFVESRQSDGFVDSNSLRVRALVFPRVEKRRGVHTRLRWKRRR